MRQLNIDYYFAPQSPWAYLGHQRFTRIARRHSCGVRVLPIDVGELFPVSGGLALSKRAPQRQAYRLQELKRFSGHLGLPLNLHPRYFPVAGDAAARLIMAVDIHDGSDAALQLAGAVLESVWCRESDIASEFALGRLLHDAGLAAQRLIDAAHPDVQRRYESNTAQAIASDVFGVPTYKFGDELFWGQDRLDFLERKLQRAAKP